MQNKQAKEIDECDSVQLMEAVAWNVYRAYLSSTISFILKVA